jgi:DNA-binding response OmpR family regulator
MSNIILLETDRQLAKYTADYLKQQGHKTEVYSDPQSAISSADKHCPDCVVLSLLLAGRSGIEFLYELRSYPEWQKIPVIVTGKLSAEELNDYTPVFNQLGVTRYLHKSTTSLTDLAVAIQGLLQPVAA